MKIRRRLFTVVSASIHTKKESAMRSLFAFSSLASVVALPQGAAPASGVHATAGATGDQVPPG